MADRPTPDMVGQVLAALLRSDDGSVVSLVVGSLHEKCALAVVSRGRGLRGLAGGRGRLFGRAHDFPVGNFDSACDLNGILGEPSL
ncbi:hypothetical protein [Nocardia noduli]|uniref:hypothetical protein n=1 Tax=Nocardia noduli TaxID=2815722 RepID=UPI001C23DA36|nr:hypothetical protein [Nocardia noduli]